jgi:ketosteroid isomerase-like protein
MSQDQTGLVRSLYDAFAKGDVPFVLGLFSPELVWNDAENFIYADGNPYVGPQAVLEGVFARLGSEWDGFSATPEEIVGSGDTVIALGRYRGTFRASGVAVNAQFAHVWKVAGGKIVRFQQYTDTAQFRDATAKARPAGA